MDKNKISIPDSIVYTNIGYQMYREPKSLSTSSDVFYNVESRIPHYQCGNSYF